MMMRHAVFAAAAILLAGIGSSPATAGEHWQRGHGGHWRATHQAIYEAENSIALLEASPDTDDGYRAPIIARTRVNISRLRATLGPAQWRWQVPCCYSRRPIYIR